MPNRTFLSHSSKDKDAVRVIAGDLRKRGVEVWFDETDIRSSDSFVEKIGQALHEATSIVVLIGPLGEADGRWHRKEINLAVQRHVNDAIPIHLFLLPGLSDSYRPPPALADISSLRFSDKESQEATVARLATAILEKDPHGLGQVHDRPAPSWNSTEDRTLKELLLEIRSANVTFYLGSLCWESTRILSNDVLLELLEDACGLAPGALTWKLSEHERVVPPLETAAAYYGLKHSQTLAADHVSDLVRQHTRQIPQAADDFAAIVRRLADNPRRGSNQAIITTNFDLTIERALLRAGVDFTRVVQNLPEGAVIVEVYRRVSSDEGSCTYRKVAASAPDQAGPETSFNRTDLDAMDAFLKNPTNQEYFYVQPVGKAQRQVRDCALPTSPATIVYKLAGSVDVNQSCLASSDRHYEYLTRFDDLIPSGITECVVQNIPVLVGYCPTGGDCRLVRYAVLHRCQRRKRFAFIPKPDENCISEFVPAQLGAAANLEAFAGYDLVREDVGEVLAYLKARVGQQFP